jgi:hypothetical protein
LEQTRPGRHLAAILAADVAGYSLNCIYAECRHEI